MKLTLSWLKEYLKTQATLEEICAKLTDIGLEVESCEDEAKALSYFSVAKIVEAKNHENSAKLKICQVEVAQGQTSGQMLQIICGAANARAGIKVAYAPIGAVIPGNQMVIKKAKIAGTESNGMLCSASELGLAGLGLVGNDEGIIEIDEKYPIGTKITEIYGKNDAVIELNVTPNRGDCLGVYGVARDLAASGIGELQKIDFARSLSKFPLDLRIINEAPQDCNLAAFRVIKNLKNCESPKWLKEKLASIGVNSISAVVDATNYAMFCLNRPMHAYDASKIKGAMKIRMAQAQEKFVSLKSDEFVLNEKMLVISDEEKVLGLAGIVGAKGSSCDLETSEILLEAAYFNPICVANSGRKLNILSDSRYRFERGVDPASCLDGIEFATKIITEICGGEVSEIKIVEGEKIADKKVEFDLAKIKKLTGLEVPVDKVLEIFTKLEFAIEKISDNKYSIKIPTHRHDIAAAEDLVEEVVRIYGYNKISPQILSTNAPKYSVNILDQVRTALVAKGMSENINWSFCDHNLVEIFDTQKPQLMLANPISSDMDHMRPNLLIGLIQSYQKNYLRNFVDLSFFEIGKVFLDIDEKSQKLMVGGIRAGQNKEKNHYNDQRDFDIFDVKKDIFDVIELFGLRAASLQISDSDAPKYYHPHRSATLKLGKNIVGYFGEIHPKITKKFDIKTTINAFEIFVDAMPQAAKNQGKKSFAANDLQLVQRDFAFLIDKSRAIGDFVKVIENCDKQLIKQVDIFDIYAGKNIPSEKKSVALRVMIQPLDKTLTSEEIEALSKKIIEAVSLNCGAQLR